MLSTSFPIGPLNPTFPFGRLFTDTYFQRLSIPFSSKKRLPIESGVHTVDQVVIYAKRKVKDNGSRLENRSYENSQIYFHISAR